MKSIIHPSSSHVARRAQHQHNTSPLPLTGTSKLALSSTVGFLAVHPTARKWGFPKRTNHTCPTVLTGVITCYNLLSKWDEPPSREENVDKMVGESHKSLINSLVLGWIVAKFLHQQFSIHGFTQIQIHMYVWWIWINYDKLCHNPLPRTHSRN